MRTVIRSENQRAEWRGVHMGNDKPSADVKRMLRRTKRRVWRRGVWREWGVL